MIPIRTERRTRSIHVAVASVAAAAVLWQLLLVVQGRAVLDETVVPPLGSRLVNFLSFFTIQSNLLVLATSSALAVDPRRDGRLWRAARMDAIVGITVTALVHWFFLRPLLHLTGASFVVDKLLHVVVPLLAVAAWVLVGPRDQATHAVVLPALAWPLAWSVYTLGRGAATHWYPYPFLDADRLGYPRTLVNVAAVAVLLAAVSMLMAWLDSRLGRAADPEG